MKKLAVLIAASLAALVAAAVALASSWTIATGHTSLGTVLASSNGHTLYLYEGDSGSHLGCSGQCLSFWPPLMQTGKVTVGGGAKSADVGSVKRGSGKQVTYNGHPLYWYAGDKKAGQTGGQGVKLAGRYWYAVSPSGTAMTSSVTTTSTTSSGSGGSTSPGW
jgi:predicted lipoprotein with Yx(FWY)xxD motif